MSFKSKNYGAAIAIYASVLLVYVLVPILVPFNKGPSSWIIYGATIFALFASFAILIIAFKSKTTIKSIAYGIPILRVGIIYFILHIIASIAIFIVDALVGVPFWIALICIIVFFALCVIGVAITDTQRRTVEKVESNTKNKISKYDDIMFLLKDLVSVTNNVDLKNQISKIQESFKYADPVSNDYSAEIEENLIQQLNSMISLARNDEFDKLTTEIPVLERNIRQRNNAVSRKQ